MYLVVKEYAIVFPSEKADVDETTYSLVAMVTTGRWWWWNWETIMYVYYVTWKHEAVGEGPA